MMTSSRSLFKYLFFVAACMLLWGGAMTSANVCEYQIDPSFAGPHFNSVGTNHVTFVKALPDGNMFVGGFFNSILGTQRWKFARLLPDGTVDNSFVNPQLSYYVKDAVVISGGAHNGKILVGGAFTTVGGQQRLKLARLNSNGTLDTTFVNPNIDDRVNSIAVQSDGKIVIGGWFDTVGGQARTKIARLNVDGTLDTTFNPVLTNIHDGVRKIVIQPDGKILVGGDFSAVNGEARQRIVRLNTDGTVDSTFIDPDVVNDPRNTSPIHDVVLLSDGKILIGGGFSTVGGLQRARIARLNSDGTVDSTFGNADVSGIVFSMGLLDNGKIIIGGQFNIVSGQTRNRLARLHANGSVDLTFGNVGANENVISVSIQTDQKVLVGGYFTSIAGQSRRHLVRLGCGDPLDGVCGTANGHVYPENASVWSPYTQCEVGTPSNTQFPAPGGTTTWTCLGQYYGQNSPTCSASREGTQCVDDEVDTTFGNANIPSVGNVVNSLLVQSDGKVVIGGEFMSVGGQQRMRLARLNTDATLDTSFQNPVLPETVLSIARQGDGSIVVGGTFTGGVVRVSSAGVLDGGFTPNANSAVRKVIVQPDGKILLAGSFTSVGTDVRYRVARVNPDGTVDTSFQDPNINGNVSTMALQADGKILIGGLFGQVGGQARAYLARLNADGTLDASFADQGIYDPGVVIINAITVQNNGRILVGGRFTQVGGQGRENMARILAIGGLDTTFINAQVGGVVNSIAVDLDDKIIAVGDFSTVAGQSAVKIVRLQSNGTFDTHFNSPLDNVNSFIKDVQVTPQGKFYVGGDFITIGGILRDRVARLGCDGGGVCTDDATLDTTFMPPNGLLNVTTLAKQTDGKLIVGGKLNNTEVVLRVSADGVRDNSFQPIALGQPALTAVIQADGKILLGGAPGTYGSLSRWNSDGTQDSSFAPTIEHTVGLRVPIVMSIVIQSDGKIVIGGQFNAVGGQQRNNVARLETNGTVDINFSDPQVNAKVNALALQPDDKVLIGGLFTQVAGQQRLRTARLNSDGTIDTTFANPQINSGVNTLLLLPDGTLLVGGAFSAAGGAQRALVAKFQTGGTLDTSFQNPQIAGNGTIAGQVYALARQADGKIIVGGNFTTVQSQARRKMARLEANGALDTTFGDPKLGGIVAGGVFGFADLDHVLSLLIQPNQKIVVGGTFQTYDDKTFVGGLVRFGCGVALCGDGIVDPGEQCDDGNDDGTDSCVTFDSNGDPVCLLPVCGDSFVQGALGEECDDGINDGSAGCDKCRFIVPACGAAAGLPTPIAPSSDLCDVGVSSSVQEGVDAYTWACTSNFGGAPVECKADRQYTVTWDGNGGTGHAPTTKLVIYNYTLEQLPSNPIRSGFIFLGRNTQANGNGQTVTAQTVITNNVTFYAKWLIEPVDGVCGSAHLVPTPTPPDANDLCAPGNAINLQNTAGAYTWQCSGENGGETVSCNAPRQYTVTWDGNGGSGHVPTSQLVTYNEQIGTLPTNPTRSGYAFSGWNTQANGGGTTVTIATIVLGNVTYYAQWSANGIDGVCGPANGVATPTPPSSNLCTLGTASAINPLVGTYTWTCSGQNGGADASCSAPRQYTVTFDGNGGGGHTPTTKVVTYNTAVGTLPTNPTRAGYAFVGWNTQANGGGATVTTATIVLGNVTYYAQWSLAPIDGVCGDANGQTYPYNATGYAPYIQCATGVPSSTAFPAQGNSTTWTCSGQNGGSQSPVCSANRQTEPTDGQCGPVHGTTIYDNARTGNGLSSATPGLCSGGNMQSFSYNNPSSYWSRGCEGTDGGVSVSCQALEGWCGDGTENGAEFCDLGGLNGTPGASCSDVCTFVDCDPDTIYPPGSVHGWYCPVGWYLQGCPGSYVCTRQIVAPIVCSECGNGSLDAGEACDYSDLADPNNEFCNIYCELNACGDGIVNEWSPDILTTRSWNASGATTNRSPALLSSVITRNSAGFSENINRANFGFHLGVINRSSATPLLMVLARANDVAPILRHGQLYGLQLNSSAEVTATTKYFGNSLISQQPTYMRNFTVLSNSPDLETAILGSPSANIYDEVILNIGYTQDVGLGRTLLLGDSLQYNDSIYGYLNLGVTNVTNGFVSQVNIGDLDNDGVEDIAYVYQSGQYNVETVLGVGFLQNDQDMISDWITLESYATADRPSIRFIPIGDSDGDGVPDMLLSQFMGSTNQFTIRRLLLNTNGTIKSQSTIYTSMMNNVYSEFVFAIHGKDVDKDGVRDMMLLREGPLQHQVNGLILLMNANRTIKQSHSVDLSEAIVGSADVISLQDALFLFDIDPTGKPYLAIGSAKSFATHGAVFIFELVPPYGIQGETQMEECDEGSYCDDLVTRCDDNPDVCPGGPAECQPRYINGCTPRCLLGCGDGVLNPLGLDGIAGTEDDEECDDGVNNNDLGTCTMTCKRPSCGDGIITDFVQRDDGFGNMVTYVEMCDPAHPSTPDCPNTCILTGGVNARCNYTFGSAESYGVDTFAELAASGILCYPAGVIVPTEGIHEYDMEGNVTKRNRTCEGLLGGATSTCSLNTWTCGDGIVDVRAGEDCDDGNIINGDGCSAECTRESLFDPADETNQCTPNSFPQIEEDELLPVWLGGVWKDSVGDLPGACANASANTIVRNSIQCFFDISRGDGSVNTGTVACGTLPTQGQALLIDAAAKFAPGTALAGGHIFNGSTVQNRVNHNNTPVYGQYLFTIMGMQMDYCALRRTSSAGSVTGSVTTLSNYESCENNADDNGDGFVDCADTNRCGPVIALHCEDNFHAFTAEICNNGIDDNGSNFIDCADWTCKTDPACLPAQAPYGGDNVVCFDGSGNPINQNNPACFQFFGTGHVPEPALGDRTLQTVSFEPEEPICDAGFAVSKGYFVQQGFALSEQLNTGLDITNFTNIEGISLVAEGTAIDDSLNQIATYQGAGKRYLFDEFIDTWSIRAVNPIYPNGSIDQSVRFMKVPTAHIYFYNGTIASGLVLDDDLRKSILRAGGVLNSDVDTTSFTIVLPEVDQKLTINGSIFGNGMFISQGNIKFASSEEFGCDGSDIVEGLYVAGGSFETDTIGNTDINQTTRCRGGNLEIKGSLLGMNAGSDLAPQRRSVLNAWKDNSFLFNDSKVFQAKDLFETCYLPNLLVKKAEVLRGAEFGGFQVPLQNHPVLDCKIIQENGIREIPPLGRDKSLLRKNSGLLEMYGQMFEESLGTLPVNNPNNKQGWRAWTLLQLLPPMPADIATCTLAGNMLLCNRHDGTTQTFNLGELYPGSEFFTAMMSPPRKFFPPWILDGFSFSQDLDNIYWLYAKTVDDIKQKFTSFALPLKRDATWNTDATDSIYGKLRNIFGSGYSSYMNLFSNYYPPPTQAEINDCVNLKRGYLGVIYANDTACRYSYYPDFKWFESNRGEGITQGISRQNQIIEGSSVVISSQPKLWINLPPGATSFLNSLIVAPQ